MSENLAVHGGIGLEAALTSDNEDTRLYARLASTPAGAEIARWVNAERRRGTDMRAVLGAMAQFFVQLHAGMSQQVFPDVAMPLLMQLFKDEIDGEYPNIWRKAEELLREHA